MKNSKEIIEQMSLIPGYTFSTPNLVKEKHNPTQLIREKLEVYGIKKLIPEEVLSILTGIELSKCRSFIEKYSFSDIIKYQDILEITPTQKRKLLLLYDFCYRVNTDTRGERLVLNSSSKAGDFFVNHLKFERNEKFIMACIDSQNKLICMEVLSEGTINEAPIYPREAVRLAIGNNANSVLFSHNHPGESLQPSSADIEVTKRLKTAMNSVAINVVDHIIVVGDKYVSFAEKGLL